MRVLVFSLLCIVCVITNATAQRSLTIALGSCSNEKSKDQLWGDVILQKPDIWLWLGDNVYADTHNMDSMRSDYDRQKRHPQYQQLRQSATVIGTWDDHDYGINDGGKYFSKKEQSKAELLRFLDVPEDAPVRQHTGVYQAYTFGEGSHQVKIILLDTRSFRDTLQRSLKKNRRYQLNNTGDVLGEEQWAWLEGQLKNSTASVNIIASSIQFLANEHGFEKWGNFPKARKRVFNLLTQLKPSGVLFLSGDRHIAEFSRKTVRGLPYPLYDFTSSGLTHTWDKPWEELNKLRVGKLIAQKNYGLLTVTWINEKPQLTMQVRGKDNVVFAEQIITF